MNLVCVSGMADASASGGAGQVPTQRGTATACTRTSTFQDELAGGRTRFAWRGNCTLYLCTTSGAESCQWLWKYARKSNWTARSFLHCADDSDSPDSVFEFEPGYV